MARHDPYNISGSIRCDNQPQRIGLVLRELLGSEFNMMSSFTGTSDLDSEGPWGSYRSHGKETHDFFLCYEGSHQHRLDFAHRLERSLEEAELPCQITVHENTVYAMTEREWRTETFPDHLLDCVGPAVSERKLHLFNVACLRLLWSCCDGDAGSELFARLMELEEQVADGRAKPREIVRASQWLPWSFEVGDLERPIRRSKITARQTAINLISYYSHPERNALNRTAARSVIAREQCHLLRDIVCPPFRTPSFTPDWRTWNDGTISRIARDAYESRDFSALPILADALQDAGCTDDDILSHCRQGDPHTRGCWVVDLILDKK